jgi:nucleoside-diphosphate-sugar epimerase
VPADAPTDRDVVIVTGSSGLLGSRVVRHLHDRYQVVGFDVRGDPVTPPDVEFVPVDLTSDESVGAALARVRHAYGERIASVIHLAAFVDFSGEPNPAYDAVTVEGTRRLLRALHGLRVDQLVFSSTMLVHRPVSPGERLDEDQPLEPAWPYPASKVRTEQVIRDEHGSIPAVVLRIAGVYDDEGHSPPLTNQIRRIHGGQLVSHLYPGDPDAGQAYLHADDLLDAVDRVIERRHDLPAWCPLLLGEEEVLGYQELQDLIGEALHDHEWRTIRVPRTLAKVGAEVRERNPFGEDPFIRPWMVDQASAHYALDTSRARELLGWVPRRCLRESLATMLERLRDDPAGWYAENSLEPPRRVEVG